MDHDLIAACEMFLVPSTILFAALGIATTEALKSLISAAGIVTAGIWSTTVIRWNGLTPADFETGICLSGFFALAWVVCLWAHVTAALKTDFKHPKEVLHVLLVKQD